MTARDKGTKTDRLDFLISYAHRDQAWAEWLAQVLESAGYTVFYQSRDVVTAGNFIKRLDEAIRRSEAVVLVMSAAYFESDITPLEWTSALASDKMLIPVRVEDVAPPGLLADRAYIDLVGLDEDDARAALGETIERLAIRRPRTPVRFVSRATYPASDPEFAGSPRVGRTNLPPPREDLVYRTDAVESVVSAVLDRDSGRLTSVTGGGGIGKTVIAQQVCRDPRVVKAFPGGVWMATAGQDPDWDRVLVDLARAAGGGEVRDTADPLIAAIESFGSEPTLVLLDDVWSPADDVQAVVDAFPSHVSVLMTTRSRDLGGSEVVIDVLGTADSRRLLLGDALDGASEQLLKAADELIAELDGWPLLLSISANLLEGSLGADDSKSIEAIRQLAVGVRPDIAADDGAKDRDRLLADFLARSRGNRENLEPGSAESVNASSRFADAYMRLGRLDDAIPLFEGAVESAGRLAEDDDNHIGLLARALGQLASGYHEAGLVDESRSTFEQAVRSALGSQPAKLRQLTENLAARMPTEWRDDLLRPLYVLLWRTAAGGRTRLVHDQIATEDQLGRRALATEIASLIERLAVDDKRPEAFALHIDAPWGAGKSTMVGFIAEDLRGQSPPWLVVQLDAWRSSQFSPAWWALLSHLRNGVRSSLSGWRRTRFDIRRFWQESVRLWRYWLPPLIAFAVLATWDVFTDRTDVLASAQTIGAAIALLVTIGAIGSQFLSLGSIHGARLHERLNDNPMKEVADQLRWVRARTSQPILLVLDDVDRCNESFAVELLDAVQTLMRSPTYDEGAQLDRRRRLVRRAGSNDEVVRSRQAYQVPERDRRDGSLPALVVLAVGDHRWMRAAYEDAYRVFAPHVAEPGRPLGQLFLDKLFQLRIELPQPSPRQMDVYLRNLLGEKTGTPVRSEGATDAIVEDLSEQAKELVRSRAGGRGSVDDGLMDLARQAGASGLSAADIDKVVAAALAARRDDPERERREEHLLQKFAGLIEPNPRVAKRFVMAYDLAYAARLTDSNATNTKLESDTLALWTVVSVRWPALAEWIREQLPSWSFSKSDDVNHPSRLLLDPEVIRVISSSMGGPLDREKVMLLSGYGSSSSAETEQSND